MKSFAILVGLAVALGATLASAENFSVGSIEVGNPWTRATPRGAPVAVVYMTITNKGSVADRLVGGSTAVAGRFEVHNMVTEDGVAKMRPVTGGLEIKPGSTVTLEPGGLHGGSGQDRASPDFCGPASQYRPLQRRCGQLRCGCGCEGPEPTWGPSGSVERRLADLVF